MSQHAAELCTLLVDEVYGELSSRVFNILLRLGRLPLPALLPHVRLPPRQLHNALAVLIQQHLVLHFTSPEDGTTYYEADWESAFALVRTGKVIELAHDHFGETAAEVTSNLLLQGHAAIGDLVEAYANAFTESKKSGKVAGGGARGIKTSGIEGSKNATTLTRLNQTLSSLLDSGYVMQVRTEHFWPLADCFNEAERKFKGERGSIGATGTKAKLELKERVLRQVRLWRDGDHERDEGPRGVKRVMHSQGASSAKRIRLDHSDTNGGNGQDHSHEVDDDDVPPLDDTLVVRVSHEKYVVALRNRELVRLAKQKTSTATSLVYAEVLRHIEPRISRCHDPLDHPEDKEEPNLAAAPTVSTLELFSTLPPTIDLAADIGPDLASQTNTNPNPPKKRRKHPSASEAEAGGEASPDELSESDPVLSDPDDPDPDDDYLDTTSLSSARRARMQQIKQHLLLLTETIPPLLIQTGTRGLGEYAVPFDRLVRHQRLTELENLIEARFGACALRLTRILSERGSKLDEKTISNLALIKQKEIRVTLTAMHEAGFLELQEVPRDNSRAPSRTIYLWCYDAERVRLLVLEDAYKCMARVLQRARSERGVLSPLLAKAERSDVKGNEETYLSVGERQALRVWEEKEERLLVQLGRLERLVGVLRDF